MLTCHLTPRTLSWVNGMPLQEKSDRRVQCPRRASVRFDFDSLGRSLTGMSHPPLSLLVRQSASSGLLANSCACIRTALFCSGHIIVDSISLICFYLDDQT